MQKTLYSLSELTLKQDKKPDTREQLLLKGVDSLSTQELTMVLLGSGIAKIPVRQLAAKVLKIIQTSPPENCMERLLQTKGIGEGKACLIAAALELGRRLHQSAGRKISTPLDILPLIQHCSLQKQEHFLCISLNGAQEILNVRTISVGTLNRSLIHPREVFSDALKERAAAVILSHNHPSGNPQPSQNDIEVTKRLFTVSEIIGIHVLDHIIITSTDYFSFVENGLVFNS